MKPIIKQKILPFLNKSLIILFPIALVLLFLRPSFMRFDIFGIYISMTSARNISILMGILWVAIFCIRRCRLYRKTPIDKWIGVFFVWFIITCFFAEYFKYSIEALHEMFVFISFYFVASEYFQKKQKIKIFYKILAVCIPVVCIINLLFHVKTGLFKVIEDYPFWPGKQGLALFIVFGFSIILAVTIYRWKQINKTVRIAGIILLVIQFVSLIFVYSRGAWLTLLIVVLILSFFKSRKVFKIVLLIALVLVLLASVFLYRHKDTILKDDNIMQRFRIWDTTIVLIKDNALFGVGPGNFGVVHLERYREKDKFSWWGHNYHAHNLYFQIMSEIGIIGFILFAVIIWKIISRGYVYIKNDTDDFITGIRIGVFAAFLGFLFWSIAECTYEGDFSTLSFFHINLTVILFSNLILYQPIKQ